MEWSDLLDGGKLSAILRHAADMISLGERIEKLPTCNDCAKQRTCEYVPKWGETVRINCPLYKEG